MANARLDGIWQMVPEAEAEHVVVDMDSIYGPMSWIRLHANGKYVIGMTSAPRTRTNYHLERPVTADGLTRLLGDIARAQGVEVHGPHTQASDGAEPQVEASVPTEHAAGIAPTVAPTDEETIAGQPVARAADPAPAADAPVALPPATSHDDRPAQAADPAPAVDAPVALPPAPPHGDTPAPAPMDQLPEEQPLSPDEESQPPPVAPLPAQAPAAPAADATADGVHSAAAPAEPIRSRLVDWLKSGQPGTRTRFRSSRAPTLYLDTDAGIYFGPQTLKPLAEAFEGDVRAEEIEPLDSAAWSRETASLGASQPLARLHWYGALLSGKGRLLPGNDPAGRYRLLRWPQTEREFPRHFRIATAMMKGPATLADVAAASGVPVEDVADFVNASLASGYAEYVWPTSSEPTDNARSGGLLGRLRGR